MKFFIDNCLAPKHADGLHGFVCPEHEVHHLRKKFAPNTPDTEWMLALACEDSLIILTADVRISRNQHEVDAWMESGKTVFFLAKGWTNIAFWDQAKKLVHHFPSIIKQANRFPVGSGFIVPVSGSNFKQIH